MYIINNSLVSVIPENAVIIKNKLPLGNYQVIDTKTGLTLQKVDDFSKPEIVYGEANAQADRIINTFKSRVKNTGVLLNGEKGSGKTFLARLLSYKLNQEGISTILVTEQFDAAILSDFIKTITDPVMIFFDEFEKIYTKNREEETKDPQSGLLSLLDGMELVKKLFVFTCNNSFAINDMMKNRPGRIFYNIDFSGLSESVVTEYCEMNLKNKSFMDHVLVVKRMFRHFTFDMLQGLIEEVNRYNESPLESVKMMNIIPISEETYYNISAFDEKMKTQLETDYLRRGCYCNPFSEDVSFNVWKGKNSSKKQTLVICKTNFVKISGEKLIFFVDKRYRVEVVKQAKEDFGREMWGLVDPYACQNRSEGVLNEK